MATRTVLLACADCGVKKWRPRKSGPIQSQDVVCYACKRLRPRVVAVKVFQLHCADCGNGMVTGIRSLPQGQALCHPCRQVRARAKTLLCADCGKNMERGSASAPQGQARCQPCKRIRSINTKSCRQCHVTFVGTSKSIYCTRACAGASNAFRPEQARTRYAQRQLRAPGLNAVARAQLLTTWQQQRKTCAYCPAIPTTVDHIVPLVRGGTNHEGNLAPCCRPCNSSKSGWLLTEWRTGRRCTTPGTMPTPRPTRTRTLRPRPALLPLRPCYICGQYYQPTNIRQQTCNPTCGYEHSKRRIREKYRTSVGLPPTWDIPTTPQRNYTPRNHLTNNKGAAIIPILNV